MWERMALAAQWVMCGGQGRFSKKIVTLKGLF
jgi:hypothetical protein